MFGPEGGLGVAHGAQHPAPVGIGTEHSSLYQGGAYHSFRQPFGALFAPGAGYFAGDQPAGPFAVPGDGPGQPTTGIV